ncbi:MAG: MarR family transcriptional regulator [Paludibacterium sp.]|uniref:MarR family winged helix-turn-helix transcriptional regulator n=1 Tax=Paludibacterium sp. TaxID=1917523 RepID=UPI0025F5B6DF|nr:MarR family transcriptional regulator [Paludibacterium sp.]MBV8047454.1 MarR family transcriptional regulator [Paludibacterium sp.]
MIDDPPSDYRHTMTALFHAYRALTAKPDAILARRGLARVHHRILFFVACQRGLSVKELLAALGVTKQAVHQPIRQLVGMGLIESHLDPKDKRVKRLQLTPAGTQLEAELHGEQVMLLDRAFHLAGRDAVRGWATVCETLADADTHSMRS